MKIVVLAGGTSTEREISIVSGTGVCKALRSKGHRAVLMDVFCGDDRPGTADVFEQEEYDADEEAAYIRSFDDKIEEMKGKRGFIGPNVIALCRQADAVFLALHGQNGEDGKVQAALELMGVPFTGCGHLGSGMAMDKAVSKELFKQNGVPTPEGIVVRAGEEILPADRNGVGLPCVVKPNCGGSSVGVSIARTQEEYERALQEGFGYEPVLVVEQYIRGREFSVGVVDGEAYPVIEIAPIEGFYDYHNKYAAGSAIETCPADLPQEVSDRMQYCALVAWKALRLESYARFDMLMDEEGNIYCLEANTLPGMTPTSLLPQEAAAIGISYADLCEKIINVSLKGRKE